MFPHFCAVKYPFHGYIAICNKMYAIRQPVASHAVTERWIAKTVSKTGIASKQGGC